MDHYREVRPTDLSCQGLGGIHHSCADQCALGLACVAAGCVTKSRRFCLSVTQANWDKPLRRLTSLQSPCYSSVERDLVRSRGISYTRVRELVKDAFRGLTAVSKIGVHSLTAGGATSAANAGIPDRLVKRYGRWASENAKNGYVKDDFNSRLLVSRSLSI